MPPVVITHNDEQIEPAVREALDHLEIEPMVRGRLVAVKPNETMATAEDSTGVTQPDTLRSVIRYIKQFSPRHLVVSGGSGAAKTDEVFRLSGLMQVVEEEGVEFFDHNLEPFKEVDLDYAPERDVKGPQKTVMVNPRILEYETLIALNQLKVHATATVTLALKNIAMSYPAAGFYGYPRGSEDYNNHQFFDDMSSFIAAMYKRFPIDLAITVGHPAMIGRGPLNGHTFETGLVIASPDAPAADVVGAHLLGFNPDGVHHIWEAGRLKLGETDTKKMTFPALRLDEAVGIFTKAAYGERLKFS
jgi:uncharacterized protein (DUF362 family)